MKIAPAIAVLCLAVTGCGYPYPLHAHKWGEWTETKVGTLTIKTRACLGCDTAQSTTEFAANQSL